VIRTSGEHRLSNFLLLQTAYSEFYFTPIFWPEFNENEFEKAIDSYKGRERRFGKTGDQIQKAIIKE
jgi:undecaprenyl diphosphate synthase